MRFAVALLVFADLLLRGAAVPHVHACDASGHDLSVRPHVHVDWHPTHHEHHGDEDRDQAVGGDKGHDVDAACAARPEHDDAVIYLDSETTIFTPPCRLVTADTSVVWFSAAASDSTGQVDMNKAWQTLSGTSVDPADSLHTFLPHVLRV
jgi:hypothetical protein